MTSVVLFSPFRVFIEAGIVYGFSDETARRYQLFYEQYSGVEHHSGSKIPPKPSAEVLAKEAEPLEAASEYENMSKEQLIQRWGIWIY